MNHVKDQAHAAVAESRNMLAGALGIPADRASQGSSETFEALWLMYGDSPRCEHLDKRPMQPWLMGLPEPAWRCRSCTGRVAAERIAAGFKFDPIEDFTCDFCRRYVGHLDPIIVRQDIWIIQGAGCSRCQSAVAAAGGAFIHPGEATK